MRQALNSNACVPHSSRLFPRLICIVFVALLSFQTGITTSPTIQAQELANPRTHQLKDGESPGAVRYAAPRDSVWEFGWVISVNGQAKGILATVPIPMDWPEQSIVEVSRDVTKNVGRIKASHPTKESQQINFNINRLKTGEEARVIIRFKVKKQMIIAPRDESQLKIAKPVPSKLRTFLKPSPYIESNHKRIRAIAKDLLDSELSGWEQVKKNYEWVREEITYKFDTQIKSCLDALDSELGDCEELSSLFIAICRAQQIPARAVWIPGHTFPEFYLEDESGEGHWFPCQVAGSYEFGSMTELRPVMQKGDRFKLSGQSERSRYLQPVITFKDLNGTVKREWISREVTDAGEVTDFGDQEK